MGFVDAALRRPAPRRRADRRRGPGPRRSRRSALKTGPPSPEQLSQERPRAPRRRTDRPRDRPRLGSALPVIATSTPEGPITEPGRLAALSRWQRQDRRAARGAGRDRPGAGRRARSSRCAKPAAPCSPPKEGRAGQPAGRARPQAGVAAEAASSSCAKGSRRPAAGAGLLAEGSGKAADRGAGDLPRPRRSAPSAASGRSPRSMTSRRARELAAAQQKATVGALQLKLGLRGKSPNSAPTACARARRTEKRSRRRPRQAPR